jgi:hypothetical protein
MVPISGNNTSLEQLRKELRSGQQNRDLTRRRSQGRPDSGTQDLGEFYPDSELKVLMCREAGKVLKDQEEAHELDGDIDAAVKYIKQRGWRVFAILVVMRMPSMIEFFRKENFDQNLLPLRYWPDDDGPWEVESLQPNGADQSISRVFNSENWADEKTVKDFCDNQWPFIAALFKNDNFEHQFVESMRLPFIEWKKVEPAVGNSVIVNAKVHAGHLHSKQVRSSHYVGLRQLTD